MKSTSSRQSGFSLIEVMASVVLLGVTLVTLLHLRDAAIAKAADARSLSLASRLGARLMHRIEAARLPDLYDGYQGDFSEDGMGDMLWVIGIGDASMHSGGGVTSDAEDVWRDIKEQNTEDIPDDERPEYTRVFVTVNWAGFDGEDKTYSLESLLPTWAVYQDFELYEDLWGSLNTESIQ